MLIAGATTIETSQNAGRPGIGGNGGGGWNVPPGNDFAVIEMTCGSCKLAKFPHVVCAEAGCTPTDAARRSQQGKDGRSNATSKVMHRDTLSGLAAIIRRETTEASTVENCARLG